MCIINDFTFLIQILNFFEACFIWGDCQFEFVYLLIISQVYQNLPCYKYFIDHYEWGSLAIDLSLH